MPALKRSVAAACLLAPFVGLLWVPWYASAEPRLAGMPFFYWYQLAWIPGSVVLMSAAHRLTRHKPETPHPDPGGRA